MCDKNDCFKCLKLTVVRLLLVGIRIRIECIRIDIDANLEWKAFFFFIIVSMRADVCWMIRMSKVSCTAVPTNVAGMRIFNHVVGVKASSVVATVQGIAFLLWEATVFFYKSTQI